LLISKAFLLIDNILLEGSDFIECFITVEGRTLALPASTISRPAFLKQL
jgi:hypothetical protein